MNKKLRFLSLALVFVMLLNFSGCFDPSRIADKHNNRKTVNEEAYSPIEDITFNLPYLSTDSLDPFIAQSEINRNLTSLIYDSLYAIDNSFKPVAQIAEKSKIHDSYLVVTIKSGLTFSDGSFVTVSDVIYSFDKAKESERYKNELEIFDSAEATGNHDITFTMNKTDRDAAALLNFPVIKLENKTTEEDDTTVDPYSNYAYITGTEDISESVFKTPVGSGRYYLAQDDNKVFYLCCNAKRLGGYFPKYRNIGLVATADTEQLRSMYSLGRTNVIYDTYSTGEYSQIIGTADKITLSNFIYLVPNKNSTVLQDSIVRKAISYALNRQEICDFSFVGNASPAELPFPQKYYKTESVKAENNTYNDAIRLLENNGYTEINNAYNFRYNPEEGSKVLEFRLAVCKNNSFKVSAAEKIKEQLNKVNIRIEIYKYEESDFFNVISSGAYDLYLGECKMKNDMNFSGFFAFGNVLSNGIDTTGESAEAYSSYQNGDTEIDAFINAFKEEYPIIPILYREGNIFSNSLMAVADKAIVTDYYYNIDKWKTVND